MSDWRRYRFQADPDDPRPVTFPPPGPFWISGYAGDDSHAVVVAYLPSAREPTEFWPEAAEIEFTEEDEIRFSSRFPEPHWWPIARKDVRP